MLSLLCSYCKGGRMVPAYVNKAASRGNGVTGLTFPYIWYCPSGTCFQLNLDNLLQFPSTVPSSNIAPDVFSTQHAKCLSSYMKEFPVLWIHTFVIFPLILSTLWDHFYLFNAVHRGSSVNTVSKIRGQRPKYQVMFFEKPSYFPVSELSRPAMRADQRPVQ